MSGATHPLAQLMGEPPRWPCWAALAEGAVPVAGSCSGWGSKYRTFDGTSYSFRGNCTHVLVREIHPRFGNLSVLLNSYYCAAPAAPRSCPRALIIHYGSTEIILSTATDAGREESLVRARGAAGVGLSGAPRGRPRGPGVRVRVPRSS